MNWTRIRPRRWLGAFLVLAVACTLAVPGARAGRNPRDHKIHSMERPHPPMVEAQPCTTEPPSDATVLFAGEDLSEWETGDGSRPGWKVQDGNMVIVPDTGSIRTRRRFGDCQLHIEWATQDPLGDHGYPGNSGVYFGPYEIQILANHSERPLEEDQHRHWRQDNRDHLPMAVLRCLSQRRGRS